MTHRYSDHLDKEQLMATQREELATQFADVSSAFIAAVEQLDESDLSLVCAAEQCTVAALVSHLSMVYDAHTDWVPRMQQGQALPDLTMDDIHRNNAKQAALNAHLNKDEVLTRLRDSSERMLAVLRGLRDDDPERVVSFSLFDGGEVSIETEVELGLIAHSQEHLASLQATVGSTVPTARNS
jgi:hypothetical protein